jgi:hypothetical protein
VETESENSDSATDTSSEQIDSSALSRTKNMRTHLFSETELLNKTRKGVLVLFSLSDYTGLPSYPHFLPAVSTESISKNNMASTG